MSGDGASRYAGDVARALATSGGHLKIGRGGFTLYHDNARLEGYDCEAIKKAAIEAGLPVIDSRDVPYDLVAILAVRGPMVAVNTVPSPPPWHAFSYAPLAAVAAAYRRAGAEVFNIPDQEADEAIFADPPSGPINELLDAWLRNVRVGGE